MFKNYKSQHFCIFAVMKRFKLFFLSLFLLLLVPGCLWAQGSTNRAYWAYIDKYKKIAVEQMQTYHIPASITMAQGLLESGAGRSRLATEAHNHFGIKCHSDWKGPYIVIDDDLKGEHFRKYKTDRESFVDHSLFLKRKRYERLFKLNIRDYKGWARGLKACGYATSPTYAESLIRIIEMYSLSQLDRMKLHDLDAKDRSVSEAKAKDKLPAFFDTHTVYANNGNYFIVIEAGDDIKSISEATGVSVKNLYRFNDLTPEYGLTTGDILYLKDKKKKGAKDFAGVPHKIEVGQSLYDVSQMYGIHLKNLYQLNGLDADYVAKPGDLIWVR